MIFIYNRGFRASLRASSTGGDFLILFDFSHVDRSKFMHFDSFGVVIVSVHREVM